MFKYTVKEINKIANETNFNINMCEKVLRLFSILDFLNNNEFTNLLALKGGTAINLFMLNLPRLSVDIDLDFTLSTNRNDMLSYRAKIDSLIRNFMENEGYSLSNKSKFVHTLDSYVYSYTTTSGGTDILKIEINYSNGVHVLKTNIKKSTNMLGETISMNCLADAELIGSKLNALIIRTTPRDVYDVYNLFHSNAITDINLIKKISIFYVCLGTDMPINFIDILKNALDKMEALSYHKIKKTLIPVLHKGIRFDVNEAITYVSTIVRNMFILDSNDVEFINNINNKLFKPDILFKNYKIEDISCHPMGLWKVK